MNKIGLRVKQQRERNEISLRDLSKKIGLSASFLSQVERGKTYPSLQSIKKIADSLHTTIGSLLGETSIMATTPVLRNKYRKTLKHVGKGVELQFLSSLDKNHSIEPCIHKLKKNAISGNPPFQHFGQEFVYVLRGTMEFVLGDNKYMMSEGDSIYFNSNIKHSFKNINEEITEILCVSSPPYF